MSSCSALLAVALVVALAADVVVHVILSRVKGAKMPMVCLAGGAIAGLLCVMVLTVFALRGFRPGNSQDFWAYVVFNLVSYLALAYGYFHFVNLNLAALRIRLLREMHDSAGGLTQEDILSRYSAEQIIDSRLERLMKWGHLVERDGRYFVGRRTFILLFWVFEVMKLAVLGRRNRLLAEVRETERGDGS